MRAVFTEQRATGAPKVKAVSGRSVEIDAKFLGTGQSGLRGRQPAQYPAAQVCAIGVVAREQRFAHALKLHRSVAVGPFGAFTHGCAEGAGVGSLYTQWKPLSGVIAAMSTVGCKT